MEVEASIKDTLSQADWMQGILRNPRYLQLEANIERHPKYYSNYMFGAIQKMNDVGNYSVLELTIHNHLKVRKYHINVNHFALYWAIVHKNDHIVLVDEPDKRRIKINFYPFDYFERTWGTTVREGRFIDIMELMARMKKYPNQYDSR